MSFKSTTSFVPSVFREFCLLFFVVLFASTPFFAAQAQESAASASPAPLWGALNKGSYDVGYRVLYAFDPSRTWRGNGAAPDREGRPVRISIWYPSAPSSAQPMRVINYVHYTGAPSDFSSAEAALEKRDQGALAAMVPADALDGLMALKMRAIADARSAQGQFPVLIYAGGINANTLSNAVMAEFLASHGYVVVTMPSLGPSPDSAEQNDNEAGMENAVRDLEFAYGVVRRLPNTSVELGAFGQGLGGTEAMMLAMRNANVDAVAGLDGSYGFDDGAKSLTGYFGYAPALVHAPVLDLRRADAAAKLEHIHDMHNADKYFVQMPGMSDADFTSAAMISEQFHVAPPTNPIPGWTRETAARGYQQSANILRTFFDNSLHGRPLAAFPTQIHDGTGQTVTAEAASRAPS